MAVILVAGDALDHTGLSARAMRVVQEDAWYLRLIDLGLSPVQHVYAS